MHVLSLCMSIFRCLCMYVCVCIPHCRFSTAELLSVKRQNSLPDRIWFPVSSVTTFLSNTPSNTNNHTSMFFFYHDGDFPLTVCTELLICLTLTETFLDFNFSLRHYLVFYLTRHCLVSTMISSCYNAYEYIWFPQHRQNVTHTFIILYYIILYYIILYYIILYYIILLALTGAMGNLLRMNNLKYWCVDIGPSP